MALLSITQGRGDKKSYRILTMDNGLEALLVSNAAVSEDSKAAAALVVQTCFFADPPIAEGCAHFLEVSKLSLPVITDRILNHSAVFSST
jgi:secreted Zn-dependent insulinase-like peptidase